MNSLLKKIFGKSQPNTNGQNKEGSFKREEIGNTPFMKITQGNEVFYTIGGEIIAKVTKTKSTKHIERQLENMDWDIYIPIIAYVTNKVSTINSQTAVKKLKNNLQQS